MQTRTDVKTLTELGLDESNATHVALILLARVAWADGEMDEHESALIELGATRMGLSPADIDRLLRPLLRSDPGWGGQERAIQVLADLSNRGDSQLTDGFLRALITHCERIAQASGSMLGKQYCVDPRERDVIDRMVEGITAQCTPESGQNWNRLLRELSTPTRDSLSGPSPVEALRR